MASTILLMNYHDSIVKMVTDGMTDPRDMRTFRLVSKRTRDVFVPNCVHGLSDRLNGNFSNMLLDMSHAGVKWRVLIEPLNAYLFNGINDKIYIGEKELTRGPSEIQNYIRMQMLSSRTGIDMSISVAYGAVSKKLKVLRIIEETARLMKSDMKTIPGSEKESSRNTGFTGVYETPLRFNVNMGVLVYDMFDSVPEMTYSMHWTKRRSP